MLFFENKFNKNFLKLLIGSNNKFWMNNQLCNKVILSSSNTFIKI